MIILIARLRIDESKTTEFRQHLQDFLNESRKEAGCIRFTASEDVDQANFYLFTELWQDESSLEQHEASAHLARFKQQIGGWIVERERSQVYQISAVRDL